MSWVLGAGPPLDMRCRCFASLHTRPPLTARSDVLLPSFDVTLPSHSNCPTAGMSRGTAGTRAWTCSEAPPAPASTCSTASCATL